MFEGGPGRGGNGGWGGGSGPRFRIGQLARRSGVPVRTVRFWSDQGVLPPSGRDRNGYRYYDTEAVIRLDLVRALRELGMGLDDVRAVLERRRGIADVAAAHIRVIDEQIRGLRTQRAVCTMLARADHDEGSATLMNDLARLSAVERQQMIDEFVDQTFAGIDPNAPGAHIADGMRRVPSELPDHPRDERVAAWVELAELVSDESFRDRVRQMALSGSNRSHAPAGLDLDRAREVADSAWQDGIDPASPMAVEVLERVGAGNLDAATRSRIAEAIEAFTDRRVERYWQLLAVLNGWPVAEPAVPAMEWLAAALRAQ